MGLLRYQVVLSPSSKPLPLLVSGYALQVLQRWSIWLWAVEEAVVVMAVVVVVQVGIGQPQVFLLPQEQPIQLLLVLVVLLVRLETMATQVQILFFLQLPLLVVDLVVGTQKMAVVEALAVVQVK
jgi:hypothetical protein